MCLWRSLVNNCGMCRRGAGHHSWNNWVLRHNQGVIKGQPDEKKKTKSVILCLYDSQLPVHLRFSSLVLQKKHGGASLTASVGVPSCRGRSHTYSLVLLGGPLREPPMDGYLATCFFRGQEAANMAPPKTSSREPPQAMKMAAPNSNLGHERGWPHG